MVIIVIRRFDDMQGTVVSVLGIELMVDLQSLSSFV